VERERKDWRLHCTWVCIRWKELQIETVQKEEVPTGELKMNGGSRRISEEGLGKEKARGETDRQLFGHNLPNDQPQNKFQKKSPGRHQTNSLPDHRLEEEGNKIQEWTHRKEGKLAEEWRRGLGRRSSPLF